MSAFCSSVENGRHQDQGDGVRPRLEQSLDCRATTYIHTSSRADGGVQQPWGGTSQDAGYRYLGTMNLEAGVYVLHIIDTAWFRSRSPHAVGSKDYHDARMKGVEWHAWRTRHGVQRGLEEHALEVVQEGWGSSG